MVHSQVLLDVFTIRKIKPPKIQVYSHSPKTHQNHIANIWWMKLNQILSWRHFCRQYVLTWSWRVSVHCPITLYPGVLLIFIWYWKRSYRPGASPFRLNVTDVTALPTKERLRLRNLPSTLSDKHTVYQSYIMKKTPWHASQTTRPHCLHFHFIRRQKLVWLWQKYKQRVPLRPTAETDKTWHSSSTDCLKSFTCRAWH